MRAACHEVMRGSEGRGEDVRGGGGRGGDKEEG